MNQPEPSIKQALIICALAWAGPLLGLVIGWLAGGFEST